jgi:formamidopyrimidine-DNA glycosylase
MPELPEVESIRKSLSKKIVGQSIQKIVSSRKDLRQPVDLKSLRRLLYRREIIDVRRRAKYLLIEVKGERCLLLHLGMTGVPYLVPPGSANKEHEHLIIRLSNDHELRLCDRRRFGLASVERLPVCGGEPDSLASLGPEPLGRQFTGKHLHNRTRTRKCAIKPLLINQTVVGGIGNIYASEALFRSRINPLRASNTLTLPECHSVVKAVRQVLRSAIGKNGTTMSDYRLLNGTEGGFQKHLRVYGRSGEPCLNCGSAIAMAKQLARSTFFCPQCQS